MVATPSVDEVEAVYDGAPVETDDLDLQDAQDLIDIAVSMHDNVFSDRIVFTSEALDGDESVKYLAAHKWAIALGDEIQSESQGGASTARGLSRTKYGQEVLEYLRTEPNVSIFRG